MTELTKNFTLNEATRSDTARKRGISNTPSPVELERILETALQMEQVRSILGDKPILINSWFRNAETNRAAGGVANSDHLRGDAVDFRCPGYGDPTAICKAIIASGIKFDQLIWEYGRWTHISFGPRMRQEVLHITGTSKVYRKGLPD